MTTLFNPAMQKEKTFISLIVILIVIGLSFLILMQPSEDGKGTILDDILENLLGEGEEEIVETSDILEIGDCADVHYIGRYASNDTVFSSSYDNPENMSGEDYLLVFVSNNTNDFPPTNYSDYYSSILTPLMMGDMNYLSYTDSPLAIREGFIETLLGMKRGEMKSTGSLPPDKAFGTKPMIGDTINLSSLFGITYVLSIYDIQYDAPMPAEYATAENQTTTLIVLRQEFHNLGDVVEAVNKTAYVSWENASKISKINETKIWIYTTPSTEVDESFTWIVENYDEATGSFLNRFTYPENASYISSINESTISIEHNPDVGENITVNSGYSSATYTVESVSAGVINTSYSLDGENISYREFESQTIIERNYTQNITVPVPAEILESQIFIIMRALDENFSYSFNRLAGENIYFELFVEEIYKTSVETEES